MPTEERVWTTDKNCEVYYDGKYKAVVKIMDDFDYYEDLDPRLDDNVGKICIKKHRNYRFPNELDFNFDAYDEGEIETPENYYIFRLDCYEHGQIVFSFVGEGIQCRWDTAKHCGFIAVPKKYNRYDCKEISETKWKEGTDHYDPKELSRTEAKDIAKGELKIFNQYNNGEIYEYEVYEKVKWTSEYGDERYEWECENSTGGYWDEESAKEDAIDYLEHCKKD